MHPRLTLSAKLVPFGTLTYEMPSAPQEAEAEKQETPTYIGPPATGLGNLRISYEDHNTYSAPRTTAGTM